MGVKKGGPETSHEQRLLRKMEVVYEYKMQERQIFMEELKVYRKQEEKRLRKILRDSVGPIWYQALSVPQRACLDEVEAAIYQDLLEDRATRTGDLMKRLGLYPRPSPTELLRCCHEGHDDPKKFFGYLFFTIFGHHLSTKRLSYNLNARLILSAIFYLGLKELIKSLREIFHAEQPKKKPPQIKKPVPEKPLESPYLQKMVAALYDPIRKKRGPPPPLPNLEKLNTQQIEVIVMKKPPPLPPPPPPPKPRLPRSYCDKLADVYKIELPSSETQIKKRNSSNKKRASRRSITFLKKTEEKSKPQKFRKPKIPSTGMSQAQHTITGVYTVNGKRVFVLGNVSILPVQGELIHGGHAFCNGDYVNVHCGYRGSTPDPLPDPCDCMKRWHTPIFQYVKSTKCRCGHHYDFGNEGTFPEEELPYFYKPTPHSPGKFDYRNIFTTDPKTMHVDKEFKKLWDNDSILGDDGKGKGGRKKWLDDVPPCLGPKPKPEDYLKCALNLLKKTNLAALLPDCHLTPELKEWMRRRIHGPYTDTQKRYYLRKSSMYWQILQAMEVQGFGHVSPKRDPIFREDTTWLKKQSLNDYFTKYVLKYKVDMFRAFANVSNLFWSTMFQAQFPDKHFREIFFTYFFPRMEDLSLIHPYSKIEMAERSNKMKPTKAPSPADGEE